MKYVQTKRRQYNYARMGVKCIFTSRQLTFLQVYFYIRATSLPLPLPFPFALSAQMYVHTWQLLSCPIHVFFFSFLRPELGVQWDKGSKRARAEYNFHQGFMEELRVQRVALCQNNFLALSQRNLRPACPVFFCLPGEVLFIQPTEDSPVSHKQDFICTKATA